MINFLKRFLLKFDFFIVFFLLIKSFINRNTKRMAFIFFNKSPHLTLYYPLNSSISSVIIRFMGVFLVISYIFIINFYFIDFLYDFSQEINFYNCFIWVIVINFLNYYFLIYHIIYSFFHIL